MTAQAEGSAEMVIRPSPARERWRRSMMLPYEPEVTIRVEEYDALKGQAAAVAQARAEERAILEAAREWRRCNKEPVPADSFEAIGPAVRGLKAAVDAYEAADRLAEREG